MSRPAAAAAVVERPLSRWDHLFADARDTAAKGSDDYDAEGHADLFRSHVMLMLPGLSREERDLLEVDSRLDYQMHFFEQGGSLADFYSYLNYDADFGTYISPSELNTHSQPVLVHQLRRIRAVCPTGWAALVRWITIDGPIAAEGDDNENYIVTMQLDDDGRGQRERASRLAQMLRDTFTLAEIANANPSHAAVAPDSARSDENRELGRKLERLANRILSLSPAEAKAEMIAILSDVEDRLP